MDNMRVRNIQQRLRLAVVTAVAMILSMSSCEELSKDGSAINEVIEGTWSFTYELTGDVGMDFNYEHVIFRSDGTCAITYPDGQLSGTYQASDDVIMIDSEDTPNAEPMAWRILSF